MGTSKIINLSRTVSISILKIFIALGIAFLIKSIMDLFL